MKTGRTGFTLIEILIVIGIITILAGILLPVFSRVRESGRGTTCSNNIKELCRFTTMYATDWEGYLMAPVPTAGGAPSWDAILMQKYANNQTKLLDCPTHKSLNLASNLKPRDYAYCGDCKSDTGKIFDDADLTLVAGNRLSDIPAGSRTVMFFELNTEGINSADSSFPQYSKWEYALRNNTDPADANSYYDGAKGGDLTGIHNERTNIAYVSGSVSLRAPLTKAQKGAFTIAPADD